MKEILSFEELEELARKEDNESFVNKVRSYNEVQLIHLIFRLFAMLETLIK